MANTSVQKSKLVEYLNLRAEQLRTDLRGARLFLGTTDTGNIAEHAVREFLVSLLPAKYSVGVGEVINAEVPDRIDQSQQKDVVIYDQYINTILGWGSSNTSLFPVESVYGVLEVKTSISNQATFNKAVKQAIEVKKLCNHSSRPFTGVFIFDSQVKEDTLFNNLASKEPKERTDFVLILKPKSHPDSSCYLTHWNYRETMNDGGPVRFVSAAETSDERERKSSPPIDKLLTLACTEDALLWFYLFLLEQLDNIELPKPNLLEYVDGETRETLGHCRDESENGWR